MRIGIDVRALMERRTTGVQVYVKKLLQALFRLDRKNTYFLFANGLSLKESDLPKFDFENVEYRIFHFPNKLLSLTQKTISQPKVDRLLGGLDLFFAPHWRITALSSGIPLVITFHDLSFEIFPEFFSFRQRLWHRLMGFRKAASRAKKIIAVSESTAYDLRNLYNVSDEKVEVIYSGVAAGDEARARDYFLFFATFEPRKNIQNVLHAYHQYHQSCQNPKPLVMAGSTGWKTRLKVPKKIIDSVTIFENVSEQKKSELYRDAFALIFVSYYEGFGFPVLESASFGKPVIASFSTSLSEVGKGFSLFVNPFRPQQIARAMLALDTDDELYAKLSKQARFQEKRFNWHDTAEQTLELFNQINAESAQKS